MGYLLRWDGAPNWVRFHSLPESKRYAETDQERAIILERQNALALKVLGPAPCWLVQVDPFTGTPVLEPIVEFGSLLPVADEDFVEAIADEDENPRQIYATPTRWTPGGFDDLLMAIAYDQAGATLWMSEATGAIFAPYDGGVDLFLPEPGQVAALKDAHRAWLSDHPEGL